RPAIDTGRTHGNEEPPVESGVLGLHRPVAGVGVRDHHTASLPARSDNGWRISDGAVRHGYGCATRTHGDGQQQPSAGSSRHARFAATAIRLVWRAASRATPKPVG